MLERLCYSPPMAIDKKKRPKDLNEFAASIVADATSEDRQEEVPTKNQAAVELGRLGGLKGGKARAEKLSPEQRREIAKKAAAARWRKDSEAK